MRIYVLCHNRFYHHPFNDNDGFMLEFRDVATNEKVVVIWAKHAEVGDKPVCTVYDDVGVKVGEVDLEATAKQGKVRLIAAPPYQRNA